MGVCCNLFRSLEWPREGAGPLPAPLLNLGPLPDQSYYLPPHTNTHLGRMREESER